MALTFNTVVPGTDSVGNRRMAVVDITLDGSYTTGGYVIAPQSLGLTRCDYGNVELKTVVAAGPGSGFLDCSNPYSPKLKFQLPGHTGELAANAAITGAIAEVQVVGE